MQVVWFKRDLRIHDHAALTGAVVRGPVLPLYILEPDLWQQPDMSRRHFRFLSECLYALDADLRRLGSGLVLKVGNATDILQDLQNRHGIDALWSHHQEKAPPRRHNAQIAAHIGRPAIPLHFMP